jgi:phytanoyl-CoA hydroxylase
VLTAEQRARFAADGFLVLPGFVDAAACDRLRARAAALLAGFDPGPARSIFTTDDQARRTDDYFLDSAERISFFFEEEAFDDAGALRGPLERSINKIGHALHELEPEFAAFSRTPALAALAGALGFADPRLVQSMYIFKQPFIGGEVRCHQDATFLHTEPDHLLGLWFALEDATRDNGCLWALPGGHRGGLRARFVRTGRATRLDVLDPTPWDDAGLVPLEVANGTLVLLDGHLPHLSRVNRSPRSRHAYTLHVIDGASAYPSTNWLQRTTPPPVLR